MNETRNLQKLNPIEIKTVPKCAVIDEKHIMQLLSYRSKRGEKIVVYKITKRKKEKNNDQLTYCLVAG